MKENIELSSDDLLELEKRSYCFIIGLPRPNFGLWSGCLEKDSIKPPVYCSTIFFSNYKSLEGPGLIIESLE